MNKFQYRPEIDGLRSIAVFSVIFYHAKITYAGYDIFSGGFFGVDIFFVISGYLITSLILYETKSKNFSFLKFYERRIRRILPALIFIIIVTIPFAWNYLLPHQFKDYAYSLVTSVFFSSNMYFWFIGDQYASESALLKPFLHTWSLAVEEQYYIIFPLLLFVFIKYFNKYLFLIFSIILICSLISAEFLSKSHASLNFYILPSRGWELLSGSIIAKIKMDDEVIKNKIVKDFMPLVGLFLILFSFFYFNENVLHPSKFTAIPVIGTVLMIWFCRKGEIITNILSNKFFVSFGLISYSLYLWHYPIFAFGRIDGFVDANFINKFILIFITIILSIITYFLIEKPFRNKNRTSIKSLFIYLFVSISSVIFVSTLILNNNGFIDRAPKILKEQYTNDLQKFVKQNDKECFDRLDEFCVFNKNSKKSIILVGDSSIAVLSKPLLNFSNKNNIKLTLLTNGGCPYYPNFNRIISKTNIVEKKCNYKLQKKRRELMLSDPHATIILGGRYPVHLSETLFNNKEGGEESETWGRHFVPTNIQVSSHKLRRKLLAEGFINGINELLLNQNKVILVYPIPVVGWNVPNKLMNLLPQDDSKIKNFLSQNPITTSFEVYLERTKESFIMLQKLKNKNLSDIYPHKLFCDNVIQGRCITHNLNEVFYRDASHLSYKGAKMLMKLIENEIKF